MKIVSNTSRHSTIWRAAHNLFFTVKKSPAIAFPRVNIFDTSTHNPTRGGLPLLKVQLQPPSGSPQVTLEPVLVVIHQNFRNTRRPILEDGFSSVGRTSLGSVIAASSLSPPPPPCALRAVRTDGSLNGPTTFSGSAHTPTWTTRTGSNVNFIEGIKRRVATCKVP